jgi:acyl-CoA dehydrogenase
MTVMSDDDVEQLRASARAAFGGAAVLENVRRLMATRDGYDPAEWARVAGDLGLPGLMLPEKHGGAGMTAVELGHALEVAGATLWCAPLLSTACLAVPVLLELGDEDALAAYGPRLARGELTATVALREGEGGWDVVGLTTTAERAGDGWRVTGAKSYVLDGATAGLVLVVAATPDGPGVFAVEDRAAVTPEPLVTLDLTRRMAHLRFDAVPARLVGRLGAEAPLARAHATALALLAAEQAGGAKQCLDMAVGYAKTRIQFGHPIGQFQVIKARLADLLIEVESARSAAYMATRAVAGLVEGDAEEVVRVAALTCSGAYNHVAEQNIQLHGGIGFTWEHDAHLYFKRARTDALLLGSDSDHLAALATILGRD